MWNTTSSDEPEELSYCIRQFCSTLCKHTLHNLDTSLNQAFCLVLYFIPSSLRSAYNLQKASCNTRLNFFTLASHQFWDAAQDSSSHLELFLFRHQPCVCGGECCSPSSWAEIWSQACFFVLHYRLKSKGDYPFWRMQLLNFGTLSHKTRICGHWGCGKFSMHNVNDSQMTTIDWR